MTDNGAEYSYNLLPEGKKPKDGRLHDFDRICQDQEIEHRTTLVKHPWTNGQALAMNKKVKTNTIKKYHYDSVDALKKYLYEYSLNFRPLDVSPLFRLSWIGTKKNRIFFLLILTIYIWD